MSRVPMNERMQYSAYSDLGWSTALIARHFKRKWSTVDRWLDTERKDGKDLKRTGRPRATTPKDDQKMVRRYRKVWRNNSVGRRGIDRELKEKNRKVSGKTVYRRLEEAGGEMKVKKRRFPLTSRHKRLRMKFAEDAKGENFDVWLWSDETTFEIGTRKRKVFQFPDEDEEELAEVQYRHPISQNVWACVSSSGPGEIAFIEGTLNAQGYKEILTDCLLSTAKKLFGKKKWKVCCFFYPYLHHVTFSFRQMVQLLTAQSWSSHGSLNKKLQQWFGLLTVRI